MQYWEQDPPMTFAEEGWSYEKRREFRYNTIGYLLEAVKFNNYEGKRVLCVGDGGGIDAAEFARAGAQVTVVDSSQRAIELTKATFSEAGLKVEARVGDARALLVKNKSFDAVYSFGVIHHIPDVETAVSEAYQVLVPGGKYLGMVYHTDSLLYAYSIMLRGAQEGLSSGQAMRMYSERRPGCPHSRSYDKTELRNLLGAFHEVDVAVHYDVVDLPDRRKVPFKIEGAELGWHLFFNATK